MQEASNCTPKVVDARGLACPMPLLKAKQALSKLAAGEQVQILATDPGSVKDIRSFIKLSSHTLLEFNQTDEHYVYLLEKGTR